MVEPVSVEREIAATPDELWSMVSDVTRMGEWSPETTGCSWLGGASGPEVGAKFRGSNRNGRRSWKTTCVVRESERGSVFSFESKVGPIGVSIWEYRFEPAGDGCRVTESWTDLRSGLIKAFSKPISGVADRATHNRDGMAQTLDRLAGVAERSQED